VTHKTGGQAVGMVGDASQTKRPNGGNLRHAAVELTVNVYGAIFTETGARPLEMEPGWTDPAARRTVRAKP
jgi:hypothetical protein